MALPKFNNKARTSVVVLDHGDGDVLSLTVTALPPGWFSLLRTQFEPPDRIVSGKPTPNHLDPEYNDLLGYLVIGKALLPSGALATKFEGAWIDVARALREEFRDAGFVDGDIKALYSAVDDISNKSTASKRGEGTRGN